MHEYSLVRSLIEQVERLVAGHAAGPAVGIRIAIGRLAGFDPTLVSLAYADLTANRGATAPVLTVEHAPLLACCDACGLEFEVVDFLFRCAQCGSGAIRVTSGDSVQLVDVTVDTSGESGGDEKSRDGAARE